MPLRFVAETLITQKNETAIVPFIDPTKKTVPATPATIADTLTPDVIAAYQSKKDVAMIPQSVFRDQLDKMIVKTIRPPTNRHLGTKMRETKFISITPEVWQEQLSIAKGLPPEDEDAGVLRIQESGVVKPTKTSTPRAPLPAQREMLVE